MCKWCGSNHHKFSKFVFFFFQNFLYPQYYYKLGLFPHYISIFLSLDFVVKNKNIPCPSLIPKIWTCIILVRFSRKIRRDKVARYFLVTFASTIWYLKDLLDFLMTNFGYFVKTICQKLGENLFSRVQSAFPYAQIYATWQQKTCDS